MGSCPKWSGQCLCPSTHAGSCELVTDCQVTFGLLQSHLSPPPQTWCVRSACGLHASRLASLPAETSIPVIRTVLTSHTRVFNLTLPCMLFLSFWRTHRLHPSPSFILLVFNLCSTVLWPGPQSKGLLALCASRLSKTPRIGFLQSPGVTLLFSVPASVWPPPSHVLYILLCLRLPFEPLMPV